MALIVVFQLVALCLWGVWLCFELESRGTPLPLGFFRARYCLVVGEEGFCRDCIQILPILDVDADVRRRASEVRGLDMCVLQRWVE